jgi:hypothetical protein
MNPAEDRVVRRLATLEARVERLERRLDTRLSRGVSSHARLSAAGAKVAREFAKDSTASASALAAKAGVRKQDGLRIVAELRADETRFLVVPSGPSGSSSDREESA